MHFFISIVHNYIFYSKFLLIYYIVKQFLGD